MTSSGKVRIYELSKDLGLENKDVLDAAEKLSIAAKSHSSSIEVSLAGNVVSLGPVQDPTDSLGQAGDVAADALLFVVKRRVDDAPTDGHVSDQVVHVQRVLDERLVRILKRQQEVPGKQQLLKSCWLHLEPMLRNYVSHFWTQV